MAFTPFYSDITSSLSSNTASKASFSSDTGPCFALGKSQKFLQIFYKFQLVLVVLGFRQVRRSLLWLLDMLVLIYVEVDLTTLCYHEKLKINK